MKKKFQAKSYIGYVIIPAQTATKKDILVMGRCALYALEQVAGIKSTVHQQGGSGAPLNFNLCREEK